MDIDKHDIPKILFLIFVVGAVIFLQINSWNKREKKQSAPNIQSATQGKENSPGSDNANENIEKLLKPHPQFALFLAKTFTGRPIHCAGWFGKDVKEAVSFLYPKSYMNICTNFNEIDQNNILLAEKLIQGTLDQATGFFFEAIDSHSTPNDSGNVILSNAISSIGLFKTNDECLSVEKLFRKATFFTQPCKEWASGVKKNQSKLEISLEEKAKSHKEASGLTQKEKDRQKELREKLRGK